MTKSDFANPGSAAANGASAPPRKLLAHVQVRFWLVLLLVAVVYSALRTVLMPQWQALNLVGRAALEAGLLLLVAMGPIWFFLYLPVRREAEAACDALERESATLHERLRTHDLNVRLTAALDMAEDEESILRIARQALTLATDGAPAQMLLADSPDTAMRFDLTEGWANDEGRCYVDRPTDCPAVRRGMGTVFEDSLTLSACRGMRGPMAGNCAAACTPITVAGTGVGVLRALGPSGDPTVPVAAVAQHRGAPRGCAAGGGAFHLELCARSRYRPLDRRGQPAQRRSPPGQHGPTCRSVCAGHAGHRLL